MTIACSTTFDTIITAITVSLEGAKRLVSGELRIGPRRHKLVRDEDGTLRYKSPEEEPMYASRPSLPVLQLPFHTANSRLRFRSD